MMTSSEALGIWSLVLVLEMVILAFVAQSVSWRFRPYCDGLILVMLDNAVPGFYGFFRPRCLYGLHKFYCFFECSRHGFFLETGW